MKFRHRRTTASSPPGSSNSRKSVPMALVLSAAALPQLHITSSGLVFAVASGALTSGVGYAVWYRVLPTLQATHAATVQLSVPIITALAGSLLLSEPLTLRLLIASGAVLGGIALVLGSQRQRS